MIQPNGRRRSKQLSNIAHLLTTLPLFLYILLPHCCFKSDGVLWYPISPFPFVRLEEYFQRILTGTINLMRNGDGPITLNGARKSLG